MSIPAKPSPRHRPRVMRNAVASVAAFLIAAGTTFFVSPVIVRRLGAEDYGVWVMLGSLIAYLTLLDLGVRSAVTHFVARYHAGHEDQEASRIASAALTVFAGGAVVALLCSAVLALTINDLFDLPARHASVARVVIFLLGASVAVSLVGNVYGGVVAGLQRFEALSIIEAGIELLRAIVIVVVLSVTPSLVALAVVQLVATSVRGLAFRAVSRRQYPQLSVRIGSAGRHELMRVLTFGGNAMLLYVAGIVIYHTHSIIVGVSLSATMVTYYAIAANLTSYARSTADAVANTLTPRVSALARTDGQSAVGGVVLATSRLTTLALLPVVITFLLRGDSFISLWMGPEFGEIAGDVLEALAIALWAMAWRQSAVATLCGLNRHRVLVPYFIAEVAFNLGLCLWWVHPLGVHGVALGSVLPNVALSLVVLPLLMRRELGLLPMHVWREVLARPTLAMIPFALVTFLIETQLPASSLATYFLQVALTLPAAALGIWIAGLAPEERSYTRDWLRRLWPVPRQAT